MATERRGGGWRKPTNEPKTPPPGMPPKTPHEHKWMPTGATVEREQVMRSPVSRFDDYLWTDVLIVQMCQCGEIRRVKVGEKNGRLRGAR